MGSPISRQNENYQKKYILKILLFLFMRLEIATAQDFVFNFDGKAEFLVFLEDEAVFDDAVTGCQDAGSEFTVARVDTIAEFEFLKENFLAESIGQVGAGDFSLWVGLKEFNADGANAIERFRYVDEVQDNIAFFETDEEAPWAGNQPNDLGGDQDCVKWELSDADVDEQFLWLDVECDEELAGFLCRREIQENNAFRIVLGIFLGAFSAAWIYLLAMLLREKREICLLEATTYFDAEDFEQMQVPVPQILNSGVDRNDHDLSSFL